MSTKLENQSVEIIPWVADEATHWSNTDCELLLSTDAPTRLIIWTDYVLWESSTEFMVSIGMPTDKDVTNWIEWLNNRPDVDIPDIQSIIKSCCDYIGK